MTASARARLGRPPAPGRFSSTSGLPRSVRNVLEWRLDPASSARLPLACYDLRVIVMCSEGYTSSLAAAALQDLGIRNATDLDGGFHAWQAAGLPVGPAGPSSG